MTELAIGATLNDRYKLEAELGRGGMGTVFRAHDPQLDRGVAIKVLSSLALGTEGRQRLIREAQAIAKLNHPNIVAVHDVGETDRVPFIVMEQVEGQDLQRSPPQGLADIVAVAQQVCQALRHAHQHDIIHRDLKPENVLVQTDGTVKLVDFGVARSMSSRLTSEGEITGTVYYLAPELALGREADGRADLYSLGVMLYELATGGLPFTANEPLAVVSQHVNATPVPLRARDPDIPPRFEALVLQLLEKDPIDRPASAEAVMAALDDPELLDQAASTDEELAVLGRIARGRFVGRQKELRQARAIWVQATAGDGQTLLISGEPGVGKSSLTRELATQAEISGGKAFVGECYAEGSAPYSPFSQILRQALPLVNENGSELPELVLANLIDLTPELLPYYADLPELPALDPDSEQRRLAESVVSLFSELTERAPLLLVMEDAHWADSGSLTMLRHIARRLRDRPLMLVATYREVELDQSTPLQETLVELNRERTASRLKLGRLGKEETRELLGAIFQEDITPEFLDGIYRETEGNPFFIEEMCKALVEEGKLYFEDGRWRRPDMTELELPQSVRVVIQTRLSKLPDQVQDSLAMAAVLGQEFDFETLLAASEQNEETLISALEAAEHGQLVTEIGMQRGGTFRFSHALIAATLVESQSGLRRRRMHHRAAASIEQSRPDDFEQLAHHYYESGDMDGALKYSLEAGERALRYSAHSEARRHFNRALEIAELEERSAEMLKSHLGLGQVEGVADFNRALEHYHKALELAQEPTQQATIKVLIGRIQAVIGDEQGLPILREVVEMLDPHTHGNELAQALASIARFHHNRGQHGQAIEQLEKAREIADPLGDVPTLIYVYTFLAGSYQHLGNFAHSNEWAQRQVELGKTAKYPFMEAVGNEYLAENHSFMGRWEKALQYARNDLELGRLNGLLERVRWARLVEAWCLRNLGQIESAIQAGLASLEQAESGGDARLAVLAGEQLARAHADRGELERAGQYAELACSRALELNQAYMIAEAHAARSYLEGLQGQWQSALGSAEVGMKRSENSDNRLIPMVVGPHLAEALIEAGRLAEVEDLLARVLTIARESNSVIVEAEALRVQGRLSARRGQVDRAKEHYTLALEACEQSHSMITAARILIDRAELHRLQGEREESRTSAQRALKMLDGSGAGFWIERAERALAEITAASAES